MSTKQTTHDDTGLDAVDPATHPSRSAEHFREIQAADGRLAGAEVELADAVDAARMAGEPWSVIGAALGISKQAAQQRFG